MYRDLNDRDLNDRDLNDIVTTSRYNDHDMMITRRILL